MCRKVTPYRISVKAVTLIKAFTKYQFRYIGLLLMFLHTRSCTYACQLKWGTAVESDNQSLNFLFPSSFCSLVFQTTQHVCVPNLLLVVSLCLQMFCPSSSPDLSVAPVLLEWTLKLRIPWEDVQMMSCGIHCMGGSMNQFSGIFQWMVSHPSTRKIAVLTQLAFRKLVIKSRLQFHRHVNELWIPAWSCRHSAVGAGGTS